MGKNNKPKTAPQAPKTAPNAAENAVATNVSFEKIMDASAINAELAGLEPNRRVDLMTILHDVYYKDAQAATKYNIPQKAVDNINHIVAIGAVVTLAREIKCAKNGFAVSMREIEINTINELCNETGIRIDTALLPAPSEDGKVNVPSTAISVSAETQEKIENEEKVLENKNIEIADPTKIENEEQLIAALNKIMIGYPSVYEKLKTALDFYISYRVFSIKKGENAETELKKLKETPQTVLLKEMAKLVGACPLVLNGVGRYMYNTVSATKSPIIAFCLLRNTSKNKKTGVYALSDTECADYTRTLLEWVTDAKISEAEARIESLEKNLEVLKKDEKKNAAGIKSTTEAIEASKKNIEHYNSVLDYVLAPTVDILDSIIAGYDAKDTSSIQTFNAIGNSYYDEYNLKEMKRDIVKKNLAEYAGIITNLFRSPLDRLPQYSEVHLQELVPIEQGNQEHSEEKPAEKTEEKSKKA